MATRAGVSEGAFREVFASVEECYRAAFEEGLERLSRSVDEAAGREGSWLERLRAGLVAFLGFLDDEPSWARLLVLEMPVGGAVTFECTQRLHKRIGWSAWTYARCHRQGGSVVRAGRRFCWRC